MGATFDKFLTKDDTTRVAGYIGQGNANAVIKRQIVEQTPHRQAFQLAPVMYSSIGTETRALTFKGFQQQLELMGVNVDNMDTWANTTSFNWVPPINIDMFVNYGDYFWKPDTLQAPAQYFTIENRCNKAMSKLHAYQTILSRRGDTMAVIKIDFALNAFVISGKHDDVFVNAFTFTSINNTNINIHNKHWVVDTSTYDVDLNQTTIIVVPRIAGTTTQLTDVNEVVTPPDAKFDGEWWYKYCSNTATPLSQLFVWNGTSWVMTTQLVPFDISLKDQEAVYQAESDCACESSTGGFDTQQWDDNQQNSIVWNAELLANISFGTELEWINHNTQPSALDLWYDLSTDALKQRSVTNTAWNVVQPDFSTVITDTIGTARFDSSAGCVVQTPNQWTQQNKWVHKSELTSFVGVKRAQVPILEYSSEVELNEWTETRYVWKYRADVQSDFVQTDAQPSRIELEPVKSYVVTNVAGVWYIYLSNDKGSSSRDVDYTNTFEPGYKFKIVDKYGLTEIFTVETSEYREVNSTDPAELLEGTFVTVVRVEETLFPAPLLAGVEYETTVANPVPPYTRIEPLKTSRGDAWRGYHMHWVMDVDATTRVATSPKMVNPYAKHGDMQPTEVVSLTEGTAYVTDVYQEFTPNVAGITQVNLDYRFHYKPNRAGNYAVVGEHSLRVYLNGIRQYGTYSEIAYAGSGQPDYTVVNGAGVTDAVTDTAFKYVYAIRFEQALSVNDTVRIEVCPASFYDMGMECVPVRTIADDDAFVAAVANGTQPVYRSLVRYHKNEQVKTSINQYPLFNLYDVVTGELVTTSPIFSYVEDATQAVDAATQHRILVDSTGKEFKFQQHLVDADNGVMYAYRMHTGEEPDFWYSPLTQTLKQWDGHAWADYILSSSVNGMVAVKPVVSTTEPEILRTQDASIWVNPQTLVFYRRDAINGVWNVLAGVVTASADPTLCTIWKTSSGGAEYTPSYVDAQGSTTTKGSSLGDWEVLSQWKNNPEHQNHKTVMYSQLITHLTSMVKLQPRIPGLTNNGIFAMLQKDYDYGVGGTIKEHNDAFDTLISAVNVDEMTPIGVIEFAQEQYSSNITTLKNTFVNNITDILIESTGSTVRSIADAVTDVCINAFANNEFMAKLYGDTTAYNPTTGIGMPNWIATAPMMGIVAATKPNLIHTSSGYILTHHDGHTSYINLSLAEQDKMSRLLAKRLNALSAGTVVISDTAPTSPGVLYWYKASVGVRNLYKYNNTTTKWDLVDYTSMLANVLLTVENRLYDAVPLIAVPKFNFSALAESSPVVYNDRMKTRFMRYASTKFIKTPFINTAYSLTDVYTWNYAQCIVDVPPRIGVNVADRACWQALYEAWYGTAYPHLEPWKLQGYTEKPKWWDNEYLDTTGSRVWKYDHTTKTGMWENIRTGVVPAGYLYPNSIVYSTGDALVDNITMPMYNYMSVNISNGTITGGYAPDAMLPPYYDNTSIVVSCGDTVRSLYTVFSSQIIAPSADYAFGMQGPYEWEWLHSADHVYDIAVIAFLLQPVKFLHQMFGVDYVSVGGLHIDVTTKKVYSHTDALFHGDVYNTDQRYTASGLNQWYVNFNRYSGFDTNARFRNAWTSWVPKQSYQTASIVDTGSLQLFNKNFDITDRDYTVLLANSGVVNEMWIDAFNVDVVAIPPAIQQYNNQANWKFSVDTPSTVARNVNYYGVQVWPFYMDSITNTLTVFKYDIVGVTPAASVFELSGDQSRFFIEGLPFSVSKSTTNDGSYTVLNAVYDSGKRITRVSVNETIATSIVDGVIDIDDYSHNWVSGDRVVMMSTSMLPYPVLEELPYYVIRIDSRTVRLALSQNDVYTNTPIELVGAAQGDLTIGKVASTFMALNGLSSTNTDLWYHFEVNRTDIRTIEPPTAMYGMQSLINFIDGYEAYQQDTGVVYNSAASGVEFDEDTGRAVSWQLEIERFIDWAYSLHRSRMQINDRYDFVVSSTIDNTMHFTSMVPTWPVSTRVSVTSTGTLPDPLISNTPYYIVQSAADSSMFQLSVSPDVTVDTNIVDIASMGSGTMQISMFARNQTYPEFELNPHRNSAWISTPQGVLSNILVGPYADIRVSQAIYDQYGRIITADKLLVYREDKLNRISVLPAIPNDVVTNYDSYNYIHIGGGHFFVEGYEHVIMFNNYTVSGDLLYDPFLGLAIKRFDLDFYKNTDYVLRPNLGGYFLSGHDFVRNIEGSIEDIRNYYDAYDLNEGSPTAKHARHTLGYAPDDGSMAFLDMLNGNNKFLFYRGMIQAKGSVNSVKAYINSKHFVDAKMDEFWMYKVADFGDSRQKIYPRIKLYADDNIKADIRLKFMNSTDMDPRAIEDRAAGFETITFGSNDRWVDFPQQRRVIESPLFLDATIADMTRIYATQSFTNGIEVYEESYPKDGQNTVDVWMHVQRNTSDDVINVFYRKWVNNAWVTAEPLDVHIVGYNTYIKTDKFTDGTRVLRKRLTKPGYLSAYDTELMHEAEYANGYNRVNAHVVKFSAETMPFSGVDISEGEYALLFDGPIEQAYLTGDKIKITSPSNNTFATVINSEYNAKCNKTRVRVVEPLEYSTTLSRNAGTVTQYGFGDILVIFNINYDVNKINPARLLDVKSHVKLKDVPLWHPALGLYTSQALHNIDVVSSTDPAQYMVNSPSVSTLSMQPWLSPEVSTTWFDTSCVSYKPYYDSTIYTNVTDRLYNWGKLQDWSSIKVYQWVESLYLPTEWDSVAAKQATNTSIAQSQRMTGTPRTTLFKRTRLSDVVNVVVDRSGIVQLTSTNNTYVDGMVVMFSEFGGVALPNSITTGAKYTVSGFDKDNNTFIVVDSTGVVCDLTGTASMVVVPEFDDMWVQKDLLHERVFAAMNYDFVSIPLYHDPVITVTDERWGDGDVVDVYANGELVASSITLSMNIVDTAGSGYTMSVTDIIDVVRPLHILTDAELSFDPDVDDDGVTLEQWKTVMQYSSATRMTNGRVVTYYYYWVEGITSARTVTDSSALSIAETAEMLEAAPSPYMVLQDPMDDAWARGYDVPPYDKSGYDDYAYTSYYSKHQYMPTIFYRKAVLTNTAGIIDEDDRYVLEFTRDLTLRNTLDVDNNYNNVKNKHEKWFMFRRQQIDAIPQPLWIKMTESLMGCKYDDSTVRVPTYEHEHYDALYGTDTRYGIGDGQTFVNPEYAKASIINYLQDSANDFKPIDINKFFETYPVTDDAFWTDPQKVKDMCDFIYNTFDTKHTNSIWFETLNDALVTKMQYDGLMKTSWLALHGIRVLDVGGQLDDY